MIGRTVLILISLLVAGCAVEDGFGPPGGTHARGDYAPLDTTPAQATYRAVDRMLDAAAGRTNQNGTIIVGTVADLRDVERSSPLGNLISDHIRTRLVQRGQPVSELRLRSAVKMDRFQGEMLNSRDPRAVRVPGGATEIVTGTYAVGFNQVHVTLKLLSAGNARIIAGSRFHPAALYGQRRALGRAGRRERGSEAAPAPLALNGPNGRWSGRRESNPRMQLGKLPFYH